MEAQSQTKKDIISPQIIRNDHEPEKQEYQCEQRETVRRKTDYQITYPAATMSDTSHILTDLEPMKLMKELDI